MIFAPYLEEFPLLILILRERTATIARLSIEPNLLFFVTEVAP
jgi:hypothetical protein